MTPDFYRELDIDTIAYWTQFGKVDRSNLYHSFRNELKIRSLIDLEAHETITFQQNGIMKRGK